MRALTRAYVGIFLQRPVLALALLVGTLVFFGYHARRDFRLNASADSLVLANDPDLIQLREITARYGTQPLLVVTFTPRGPLFEDEALEQLGKLRDELARVPSVESVMTLLDVPLISSSDKPLAELTESVPTLGAASVDRDRAREELLASPVFRELVISRDGRTTALLLNLRSDPQLTALEQERTELLSRKDAGQLGRQEAHRLAAVTRDLDAARARTDAETHDDIGLIRSVLDRYRSYGSLHLGGIPMIADDMITFVKSDLVVFGSAVLGCMIIMLATVFRKVVWVVLPLASCFYGGVTMMGILALAGWPVTVISSNFLALMLIITISMNIHLIVRYQELRHERPGEPHGVLVTETLKRMAWPCLYTALTTIIGFSSLVVSNIKPVQDFGWIMSAGLGVVFATSFTLFPALLMVFGKPEDSPIWRFETWVPTRLADLTERHGRGVIATSAIAAVISAVGISQLIVENSFIDYFSQETEIYQGMALIDQELGGTTPLEILLHFDGNAQAEEQVAAEDEFDDEDWLDEYEVDVASGPEYWFTPGKVHRIKQVHDYLESLPEVGKVLSLASLIRVAEKLNNGRELSSLQLGVLYKKLPPDLRARLVDPYFSASADEARIMLRILDSMPDLRRAELLTRIRDDLKDLGEKDATIAGTMVLYNNMLQSLYESQSRSIAAVLLGVAFMFAILFRSIRLSVIAIIPNILAASVVLGLMGLTGIPLDVMTITIAAITIGIAVDDAIHYIYRFREEFEKTHDYLQTLHLCHRSIGRAVVYTSITVVVGFSILVLSNFWPTIYFGLLTALALAIALLAVLTLMPRLIVLWRPFDPR